MSELPKVPQVVPVPHAPELLPLEVARNRLTILWLCLGGLFILVLILQSLFGRYGARTQEAWSWALPNIMPTLAMMLAVLGYTALEPAALHAVVRRFFFRVAFWLSAAYLALCLLTVLVQPFTDGEPGSIFEKMQQSNMWLGPIQGLVASALGVLFVTKKDT